MSIALDIGSHQIRVLESQKLNTIEGQKCPSAYLAVRNTEAIRKILQNMECSYANCQDYITVIGEEILQISDLLDLPLTSLFPGGITPADDPPARQLLNSIIESFLPAPKENNEICLVTVPAHAETKNRIESREHDEFLLRLIHLRGYQPLICSQSKALVISELATDSFTGIGVTFGAGSIEASFVNRGIELKSSSLFQAGNWIDKTLAEKTDSFQYDEKGNRFLNTDSMRKWKESLEGPTLKSSSKREKILERICNQLLDNVVEMIERELSPVILDNHFSSPLVLAVTGGTARIPGFAKMLKEKIDQADFSIEINRVKIVVESDFTVARGLLIQSILEDDYQNITQSAAA